MIVRYRAPTEVEDYLERWKKGATALARSDARTIDHCSTGPEHLRPVDLDVLCASRTWPPLSIWRMAGPSGSGPSDDYARVVLGQQHAEEAGETHVKLGGRVGVLGQWC